MIKVLYCIPSLYNPGGMERIITDKINSLAEDYKYEVTLVTTDQMGKKIFFDLNNNIDVRHLDLDFNSTFNLPLLKKRLEIKKRSIIYKKKLEEIIEAKQIDICISTGGKELEFLNFLKGNCKKVFESHFSKDYRRQFLVSRSPGLKSEIIGRIRSQQLINQTKKLDKVIVLTQHDLKDWSTSHSNVAQIYNFCSFSSDKIPDYKIKRAIAIGRLDAQKGFDMLIDSWVINKDKLVEWRLDIYGQGEWEDMLKQKIIDNKLEQNITLKGVTNDIKTELQNSSLFLFSSRYEGFGLAIIEAMTVGLPVISFDCPQGPSEMVNTDNGFLIELGDLNGFSNAIVKVTSDNELRKKMGEISKINSNKFSKPEIMKSWDLVFKDIIRKEK
ncbi:glycosyltransferase family 4 protein [Elizabethkingia anophelis]|uniref:Glycosyl transferase family 1 domain-containing protein n=4 Tax=Elizabethkingia TaxID=308865 RepID=A0A1T3GZ07_9FLAO|nr:hypothetical protein BBD31_03755 [Elizabethkingia anophelis]OPB86725.1 hypothetical protein BAS06_16190 [Elizabethkingia miricola]AQX49312.1 hypothetical protein AYC66_00825 [Elizabethkingia anophelis]AQX87657.1 hypothetical protein AYC67_00825 [Elizabethkingia anophelis]ASV80206.1 glycosyltransferase family 4 protein [Elizabethkingia anophelis]